MYPLHANSCALGTLSMNVLIVDRPLGVLIYGTILTSHSLFIHSIVQHGPNFIPWYTCTGIDVRELMYETIHGTHTVVIVIDY